MAVLSNAKWETFCRAYMRGEHAGNARACYKAIYGKDNRQAASRLLQRDDILRRLSGLQEQAAKIEERATKAAIEELGITKQKVMAELARMGFANILDYMRPLPNGTLQVDLSALERDKAAAIQEITVDAIEMDGTAKAFRVRFKLADKRAALVDLSKLAGFHIADPVAKFNVHGNVAFVDRPPSETREQWEARRRQELLLRPGNGKLRP